MRRSREQAEKRGRRGEMLAALLLRCKGYRILARRVRTHVGEIDLIAKSPSGIVCFIEVKARPGMGQAAQSVGLPQRARIVRASQAWLAGRPVKGVRFDVMTVMPGRIPRHLRDAWRADDL
ncbi:MAG: YraN family protein [Alphaproteobacteria bacterium]|nr:YraN family protein [Alphaproteobacteria bacterium]